MEQAAEIDSRAIGQRIRSEREKLNLSRAQFAEMVGLSEYYMGQLERGERQMSLPVLVRIADCLRLSLDFLVLGVTPRQSALIRESVDIPYAASELIDLLNKCTPAELTLLTEMLKVLLPYLNRHRNLPL